jgi:mannose-6-phosphate isomerase-like protein (cupin superfamily)
MIGDDRAIANRPHCRRAGSRGGGGGPNSSARQLRGAHAPGVLVSALSHKIFLSSTIQGEVREREDAFASTRRACGARAVPGSCAHTPGDDPRNQPARYAIFHEMEKVNLAEKFAAFSEHWRPKIVGELNGQEVKVVKFRGVFPWHTHASEDELFLVWRGAMRVEFRDRSVELKSGEFLVVPHGIEHRTAADEEAEIVLFEPAATRNTGDSATSNFTAPNDVRL